MFSCIFLKNMLKQADCDICILSYRRKRTENMKTFRRYLLSYLLTLFLPVGILSIVISQIVLHYCANQLLDNNAAALRQLDTSVSMQVTQFNTYVIQTTQRTEFFCRKLEKAGGFYDAQRTLLQWQITNTFSAAWFTLSLPEFSARDLRPLARVPPPCASAVRAPYTAESSARP